MATTPARLSLAASGTPARQGDFGLPALARVPHQRHRSGFRPVRPRPRRRLKRSVRLACVSLGTLLLCGSAGLLAHSARPTRPVEGRSPVARAIGGRENNPAVAERPSDFSGWFLPHGVRPAGYLIPDDGSEDAAHGG